MDFGDKILNNLFWNNLYEVEIKEEIKDLLLFHVKRTLSLLKNEYKGVFKYSIKTFNTSLKWLPTSPYSS